MSEPFGGDGGDQLVTPNNGGQTVGEYTNLATSLANNCGYTANDDGTPPGRRQPAAHRDTRPRHLEDRDAVVTHCRHGRRAPVSHSGVPLGPAVHHDVAVMVRGGQRR